MGKLAMKESDPQLILRGKVAEFRAGAGKGRQVLWLQGWGSKETATFGLEWLTHAEQHS
jgi:hypothetical protein